MSLDADRVAGLIATALLAAGASSDTPKTAGLAAALAAAIVEEITENAVVLGPSFSAPPSGGAVTGSASVGELDEDRLKDPIKSALIAAGASDIAATDTLALALATAFVDEIADNAVVGAGTLTATNTPASPGLVTGVATISGLNPVRLAVPIKDALVASGAAAGAATATLSLALATSVTAEILEYAEVVPVNPLAASAGGGPLVGALEVT